jgi:hypothetical protein
MIERDVQVKLYYIIIYIVIDQIINACPQTPSKFLYLFYLRLHQGEVCVPKPLVKVFTYNKKTCQGDVDQRKTIFANWTNDHLTPVSTPPKVFFVFYKY